MAPFNPDLINEQFPTPARNNDSVGFRNNFRVIKDSLNAIKDSLDGLEDNTAKLDASATAGINNFNGTTLENLRLNRTVWRSRLWEVTESEVDIDISNGLYHFVNYDGTGSSLTLQLQNWANDSDTLQGVQELYIILSKETHSSDTTVSFSLRDADKVLKFSNNWLENFVLTEDHIDNPIVVKLWSNYDDNKVFAEYISEYSEEIGPTVIENLVVTGTLTATIDPSDVVINDIDEIGNVSASSPADGQQLIYDADSGEWTAGDIDLGLEIIETRIQASSFVFDSVPAPSNWVLYEGMRYRFDISDGSNSNSALRFSTSATNPSASEYTSGVTISGTAGEPDAYIEIDITPSTPSELFLYSSGDVISTIVIPVKTGVKRRYSVTFADPETRELNVGPFTATTAEIEDLDITGNLTASNITFTAADFDNITVDTISATTINTDQLTASGQVSADVLDSGSLSTTDITASGTITADNVSVTGTLTAGSISYDTLEANDIEVSGSISANTIESTDITVTGLTTTNNLTVTGNTDADLIQAINVEANAVESDRVTVSTRFRPPVLDQEEIDELENVEVGEVVYNTDEDKLQVCILSDGTTVTWEDLH